MTTKCVFGVRHCPIGLALWEAAFSAFYASEHAESLEDSHLKSVRYCRLADEYEQHVARCSGQPLDAELVYADFERLRNEIDRGP